MLRECQALCTWTKVITEPLIYIKLTKRFLQVTVLKERFLSQTLIFHWLLNFYFLSWSTYLAQHTVPILFIYDLFLYRTGMRHLPLDIKQNKNQSYTNTYYMSDITVHPVFRWSFSHKNIRHSHIFLFISQIDQTDTF